MERKFEIIGEAMSQLAKTDSGVAARFDDFAKVIAFRNVLAHAYALVDDQTVWDVLQHKLPLLLRQAENLLSEAG